LETRQTATTLGKKTVMTYEPELILATRARNAGLTSRDIANCLGLHPGSVRGKLAGFSRLTESERTAILCLIAEREASAPAPAARLAAA